MNISPAAAATDDGKTFAWPTLPAQLIITKTATTFNNSLGQFAEPHIDSNDAGAALTAMTFLLSVPQHYDPGIFAYHDFKLYIKPTMPTVVFFTGRHRHGGTAPSPLPGQQVVPWAYRLAVICYPNSPTMSGESRNALVPFCGFDVVKKNPTTQDNDHKDVLKIPPEIRFRERYVFCSPPLNLTVSPGQTAARRTLLVMDPPCRDPGNYSPQFCASSPYSPTTSLLHSALSIRITLSTLTTIPCSRPSR